MTTYHYLSLGLIGISVIPSFVFVIKAFKRGSLRPDSVRIKMTNTETKVSIVHRNFLNNSENSKFRREIIEILLQSKNLINENRKLKEKINEY